MNLKTKKKKDKNEEIENDSNESLESCLTEDEFSFGEFKNIINNQGCFN